MYIYSDSLINDSQINKKTTTLENLPHSSLTLHLVMYLGSAYLVRPYFTRSHGRSRCKRKPWRDGSRRAPLIAQVRLGEYDNVRRQRRLRRRGAGAAHRCAVMKRRHDLVKLLLDFKADPNAKDKDGFTDLMLACKEKKRGSCSSADGRD